MGQLPFTFRSELRPRPSPEQSAEDQAGPEPEEGRREKDRAEQGRPGRGRPRDERSADGREEDGLSKDGREEDGLSRDGREEDGLSEDGREENGLSERPGPGPRTARERAPAPERPRREELTVSRLLRDIDDILSTAPQVWVTGELSRWRPHGSGQVYFSLKDRRSSVDCVLWRDHARRVRFQPREGMEVCCLVKPGLFQRQGRFQLTVFTIEPRGRGALHAELEARMARLREEGLTDPSRRRPLPRLPRCIGLVTSLDAAALQDVLRTTWRRDPRARLLLSPAPVQGAQAHNKLVRALRRLRETECDVVLLVRGGGSLEDLWSFNEEALARAVAEHPVPVVSGVGHETDTTLVDLVADLRASTPTGAAEAAVPMRAELEQSWRKLLERLNRGARRPVDRSRHRVERLEARLRSPRSYLHQLRQAVDRLEARLQPAVTGALEARRRRWERLETRLLAPDVPARRRRLEDMERRLEGLTEGRIQRARHRLALAGGRLQALSPLGVLARGYALAQGPDGRVLRDATTIQTGQSLRLRLARGTLEAQVTKTGSVDDDD